jgi:hypothetical protein
MNTICRRYQGAFGAIVTPVAVQILLFAAAAMAEDASPAASWTLATDDTRLVVGVGKDRQLHIYELSSPAAGWNWTSSPSVFPLMGRADIGGVKHAIRWEYQDGKAVTASDGTKVTIRWTSNEPALEITSVWHARPGRGPVRHTMFLKNNSHQAVTIFEQETFDLHVVGPKEQTNLRYISDDASVPDPIGVYSDRLTAGCRVTFEDGTNPATEKRGAELIAGVDVRLRGGLASELMFFDEIAPTKKP